jgi:hypothetical protein
MGPLTTLTASEGHSGICINKYRALELAYHRDIGGLYGSELSVAHVTTGPHRRAEDWDTGPCGI